MAKAGVIQMNSGADIEENFAILTAAMETLRIQGATLAVAPENALLFADQADYQLVAEQPGSGIWQQRIAALCRRLDMALVLGSFPLRCGDRLTTSAIYVDADGNQQALYHKLHLFDVDIPDDPASYHESATYQAGDTTAVVDSPVGALGLSICYDLRFPALYQSLRAQGAQVLTVSAAFTEVTGRAHWETLLRARAIETQCWVLAAAQCGQHTKQRTTWGHSMVISPWGEVLAQLNGETGVICTEIDHSVTDVLRKRMPVSAHSRFQVTLNNNCPLYTSD
uniref:carbon-nitrogen hydrolase family protein n=1 Tax=Thaumasiovibrio occultus TaxID=1891184 RepID=UPI000B35CD29